MALTTEQVAEITAALTQPVSDAIVGFLTADPYSLTPEESAAAASEYTNAGTDAFAAYFAPEAESEDTAAAEEEMKSYKSQLAKRLLTVREKAGAKLSSATKAELAKAIEHAATIKQSANEIVKTVKSLAESASEDDEKSVVTDELKSLRAEIETLKAAQIVEPNIDELISKALKNI